MTCSQDKAWKWPRPTPVVPWAMPYHQYYGSFLHYNRDMLDRAGLKPPPADGSDKPWTWDAMVDLAKKLTRNTGDVFLPEHYKEAIAQKTQLDSPQATEGHQARQDLIYRQQVIPTAADALRSGEAQPDQVVAQAYAEFKGSM
ncbi:MAG TPA: extracellular solute-binding protein [Chloroflexota bacterium]|nr:extracellular solute-binding protein [Chloroflexota bacterium]